MGMLPGVVTRAGLARKSYAAGDRRHVSLRPHRRPRPARSRLRRELRRHGLAG